MKPFKLLTLGLLSCGMLLAGCGNAESPATPSPEDPPTPSGPSDPSTSTNTILPFLNVGQVRFDIMGDDLGGWKYGDQTIVSTTPMPLGTGPLTATGPLNKATYHFIVVEEGKVANGVVSSRAVSLSSSIEKESLSAFLSDFASVYLGDAQNGGRAYVAISDGGGTPLWTKGLNEDLDKAIQKQVNTNN